MESYIPTLHHGKVPMDKSISQPPTGNGTEASNSSPFGGGASLPAPAPKFAKRAQSSLHIW